MTQGTTHQAVVDRQFGVRAEAYLGSKVHAQGDDLDQLIALIRNRRQARILDLGCGAGHVSFGVAPYVRGVVAYDLSKEMLETVARTAAERKLRNIVTRQGVVEKLPFEDRDLYFVR